MAVVHVVLLGVFLAPVSVLAQPAPSSAASGICSNPKCKDDEQQCNCACIPRNSLCILEPLPGGPKEITPAQAKGFLGGFLYYVNTGVWPLIFQFSVGIAVLNGVIGGFQIVLSNGESGKIDEGKNRLTWSAIGLAMILLSGTILTFLNPVGFSS